MDVPLDAGSWTRGSARRTATTHLGRACTRFDGAAQSLEIVAGVDLRDGALEVDLAVGPERTFHGVACATVSLNGRALYRGDYTYRSRDYRFLGSIGYWDTVPLDLAEGENELLVAVSEHFGGWGVQARVADPGGISFVD